MSYWKLTIDSTTDIINDQAFKIVCERPENNISSLVFGINDFWSSNYSDVIDNHSQVDLAIDFHSGSYTTVFSGLVHALKPQMTLDQGEVMQVQCWGWGIALKKTRCQTSYGLESQRPLLTHPEEILDHIAANYVEKRMVGGATQWTLDTTDVDAPHAAFDVTNLTSNYLDNFTLVQRLCDLTNAYAVANADISVHWYVDTDKHLRMKEIDQDAVDGAWDRYYGGSATAATFYEGKKGVVARNFHKEVNDYYNSIYLSTALRNPAYDTWTEGNAADWGSSDCTLSDDMGGGGGEPADAVVGDYMLKAESDADGNSYLYYPSTQDLAWDLTKVGYADQPAHLNFYLACTDVSDNTQIGVNLVTNWGAGAYFAYLDSAAAWNLEDELRADNVFQHFSIPIGPFAMDPAYHEKYHWSTTGAADWSDIDEIRFRFDGTGDREDIFVDDLCISGRIVRHAYDASEITATKKERMAFFRIDTAFDDSLETTNNTGTAAYLAESLLYKYTSVPTKGILELDMHEDMLPGQTLVVYAGLKADRSTYRFSALPMRIKKLTHTIDMSGYKTTVEVSSDVTNTHTGDILSNWKLLKEHAYALKHGQAQDLKVSGVDRQIDPLSWDPT